MNPHRILICEQNVDHAELLNYNLQKAGFEPTIHLDQDIFPAISTENPAMIILGSTTDDQEKVTISKLLKSSPQFTHTLVLCLTTDNYCCLSHSESIDACIVLPQKPKYIVKQIKELFQRSLSISSQ